MINVTNAIKNAYDISTTQIDKIIVDSKEYRISNVEYYDDIYDEGNIFGTAINRALDFEIETGVELEGKEIEYLTGIKINESIQWISLGKFIVQSVEPNDTTEISRATAMDYMLKANTPYITSLDYSTGKITVLQVLQEACKNSGLTLATTSFPNSGFIVDSNQFSQGTLNRQVIQAVAQISGTIAKIKNDNKLYLINPNSISTVSKIFTLNNYAEAEIKRVTQPINVVSLAMKDIEGENITLRDETSITKNGENTLVINNNPFAYTQAKRQQLITALFNAVKGFEYKSFYFACQGLPYLETTDKIQFKDKEGNTYDSYVFRFNYKSPNGLDSSIEAPSIIKATVNYQNIPSALDIAKRTEYRVDKQQQEISATIEKVDNITATTAKAEGKHIHLTDSANEPLVDIRLHGETSQKTRSGKNKFDRNKIFLEEGRIALNATGITITDCWATEIMINENLLKDFKANTIYTCFAKVKCVSKPTNLNESVNHERILLLYNSNTSISKSVLANANKNSWAVGTTYECRTVFATPEDLTGYKLLTYNYYGNDDGSTTYGASGSFKITELMVVEGNVADEEFELYGASPSPEFPSKIENLKVRNLFDQDTIFTNGGLVLNNDGYYVGKPQPLHALYGNNTDGVIPKEKFKEFTSYCIKFTAYKTTDTTTQNSLIVSTFYSDGSKAVLYVNNTSPKKFVFRTNPNYTVEKIVLTYSYNLEFAIKDFQVDENFFERPFVPYNSLAFSVHGENWIDKSRGCQANNGTSVEQLDTGFRVKLTSAGNYRYSTYIIPNSDALLGKTVRISANITPSSANKGMMILYTLKATGGVAVGIGGISGTETEKEFTMPKYYTNDGVQFGILFYANTNGTGNVDDYVDYTDVMLKIKDDNNTYKPYQEQIATFPLSEGQKLYEGSYLADDGVHNKRWKDVFDGTENWQVWGRPKNYGFMIVDKCLNAIAYGEQLCSCLMHDFSKAYAGETGYFGVNASGILTICVDAFKTVNEWKAYLSEQYANGTPFEVEYELSEEKIVPYTAEQQEAWNKIRALTTYKNVTNISSDAYAEIAYMRDNGLEGYETKANSDVRYTETTNKISELNISIEGITSNVGAITTKLAEDYMTTEETNSAIEQKANSITSTVSQTYITKTDSAKNISDAKTQAINSSNSATDEKLEKYSTTSEMNSKIEQSAGSIRTEVSKKVGNDEIISKINQSAESIVINADKLDISGKAVNFNTEITSSYKYSSTDLQNIQKYIMGEITLTSAQKELYDINKDGIITPADYVKISKIVNSEGGTTTIKGTFQIDPYSAERSVILRDEDGNIITSIGLLGMQTQSFNADAIYIKGEDVKQRHILTAKLPRNDNFKTTTAWAKVNAGTLQQYAKEGNKLSVSGGKIIVGAGVSKVLVSMQCEGLFAITNTGNTGMNIGLNGGDIAQAYFSSVFEEYFPASISPKLIEVSEGDSIEILIWSGAPGTIRILESYLTVEVVA